MPELTPLDDNRQEHFLNGEDLEPITRREHFYAGRESELPAGHQEPETREEWFIQKYRGGGGDVTVVPLSVTENGTYSEEGKAYSPVKVNVPLPQNAYLLKSVANLPQAIASFNDGEEMVMPSLKVAIEPQQEGSGDPSPENIRPISGWTEANVTVADDVETPTAENVYTIDLDGTRYGGTLDVVSGVLTVDRGIKLVSNCTWYGSNGGFYTDAVLSSIQHGDGRFDHVISNVYKTENISSITPLSDGGISVDASGYVQLKDSRYSAANDFKANMGTTQLVYELATPLTIQLTPTAIKSLRGVNNVYANTGDIKDAEYFSKEV